MRVSVKHLTMNHHLQTVPMEPALPMQEIWGDIQGHQYSQFHIKAFISKVIHFTVERLEPIQEKKISNITIQRWLQSIFSIYPF